MGNKPNDWKERQFVFNYINKVYDVAKNVQFDDGIDCFYNDNNIDAFLECVAKYLNAKTNEQTKIFL